MVSWLTWPVDRLALILSERRIEEVKASLGRRGYVDEDLWSSVRHISEKQAHDELERGVKVGSLERWVLYQDEDEDISLVVPEAFAGRRIRLSDAGYFSDVEIIIPKYNVKQVYVAAGSAVALQSNVVEERSGTETIADLVEEGSETQAANYAAEEESDTAAPDDVVEEESGAVAAGYVAEESGAAALSSAAEEGSGEEAVSNVAEEA